MLLYLVIVVLVVFFAGFAVWQWREQQQDRPIALWETTYPGPEPVVAELETTLGLGREHLGHDLGWLRNVALAPVWLFWGALRAHRPEQQLLRWQLTGRREGRLVTMKVGADGAMIAIACAARGLSVDPRGDFDQQEGLRCLHPVGSERWTRAIALIGRAVSLGVTSMYVEDGALRVRAPLEALSPSARLALFDALGALVVVAEG